MYHSTILMPTSMQLSGFFLVLFPEKYTKKDRCSLEPRSFRLIGKAISAFFGSHFLLSFGPQTSMMTGRIMGLRLVFL